MDEISFPSDFICSITHEIMRDPVICSDGNSYERTAIQEWLNIKNISPLTGETLSSIDVIPNKTLKRLIINWQDKYNNYIEPKPSAPPEPLIRHIKYKNGDCYVGEFIYKCNKYVPNGSGVITYIKGAKYDGMWKNGKMDGVGIMMYNNNSIYSEKHGYIKYYGKWKDNKKNGDGDMTYSFGTYKGKWKENKRHGYGIFTYSFTGNIYSGGWKDDKKHGQGEMTYNYSGDKYYGEWYEDKMQGYGTKIYENGDQFNGEFNNYYIHKGLFTYNNGNKYNGEFMNEKKHGQGEMTYANGNIYVGEWNNDYIHGFGTIIYSNGNKFEGNFNKEKRHGPGIKTYTNGETYVGEWFNDKKLYNSINKLITFSRNFNAALQYDYNRI